MVIPADIRDSEEETDVIGDVDAFIEYIEGLQCFVGWIKLITKRILSIEVYDG